MSKFYYLEGTKVFKSDGSRQYEAVSNLEKTYIGDKILVSTAFLEMFISKHKILLFETAVFDRGENTFIYRFDNYHKAIHNHWVFVDEIRTIKNVETMPEEFLQKFLDANVKNFHLK